MNELKAAVTYHSLHTMFYLTLVKIINYVNTTLRHDYYKQLIVSHRYPYSRPFWARYYGCVFYRTNKLNYIWEILSLCYTSPSSLRNLRWKSYTTLIQWEYSHTFCYRITTKKFLIIESKSKKNWCFFLDIYFINSYSNI